MDEMLTICCVYTFILSDCILLTAFDALMISLVSRASWFGWALFTLELAALFHHGWNSPGSQLLTKACRRDGKNGDRVYFWQGLRNAGCHCLSVNLMLLNSARLLRL